MTRPRHIPERLTTTPRLEPCPRCHALTLRALDHHIAALEARCDPVPLDLIGEIHARLQKRRTYDLIGRAVKQLRYRDEWRIRKREWPVLAAHKCPGPVSTKALFQARPPRRKASDERPPF